MYNFYVLDGKKLIDYKPKREHYARALERITDANGSYDLERLWQERPTIILTALKRKHNRGSSL